VILALRSPGGFPGSLNCRQQQGDQNANDRNHDQKFNQSKSHAAHVGMTV
jgi:hypothetical protein